MDNFWMAITALLIFVTFIFLYWKLTREYGKNEFGSKLWRHWPTRLSYWQGAILYSVGFTFITVSVLKWINVLPY
ncbi:hypothetical protein [Lacinutrix sp. MedPE-SW]|uniref:hypothetical protein n=1 Tax=Lacinutrix sp. MedPE-SW TaxID=1860087 RepID=UPI0025C2B69A|nr:hypothetical protein [Lacinutrix sp. MedPE-SW]